MAVRSAVRSRVPPHWTRYAVLTIVLAGAILRLWGVLSRGIYYHDEAVFLANGRFFGGLTRFAAAKLLDGTFRPALLVGKANQLKAEGGKVELHARPLHELSLVLLTTIARSATRVGPLLSALAGTANVLLLAVLGRKQSHLSGVLAAALLGVSAWHTHYSRSALSQALSLLSVCVVMHVLLQYQQGERHTAGQLRWIGLLAGLAFTSHYNLFWLPVLVGLWLAWNEWQGFDALLPWLGRLLQAAGMMLLPLVCVELLYRVLPYTTTYLQQLAHQLGYTDQIADVGGNPAFILQTLVGLENIPFLLCLLAGLVYLAWRAWKKDRFALLLLLWTLVPGVIWTVFGYPAPRSFLPMLPPLLLGAGLLAERLWARFYKPESPWPAVALACAAAGLVLAAQFVRLQPIVQARSPWAAIADQVLAYRESHPESAVDDAELTLYARPIYRYYLQETVREGQTGANLFIVDFNTRLQPTLEDKIARVESLCTPIASTLTNLGEGMIMQDAFSPYLVNQYHSNPLSRRIDVYDLDRCEWEE